MTDAIATTTPMTDPAAPDTGDDEQMSPEQFPGLWNVSAAFMYRAVVRPEVPEPPEYVTIPIDHRDIKVAVPVSQWNMLWRQPSSDAGSLTTKSSRGRCDA